MYSVNRVRQIYANRIQNTSARMLTLYAHFITYNIRSSIGVHFSYYLCIYFVFPVSTF